MAAAAGFQLWTTSVNLVFSAWFSKHSAANRLRKQLWMQGFRKGSYVTSVCYAFKMCEEQQNPWYLIIILCSMFKSAWTLLLSVRRAGTNGF